MIPVKQTIFGKGKGNCFAACIASILECPLDKVPNFCADIPDDAEKSWIYCLAEWLNERGYSCVYLPWSSPVMCYPGTHAIVTGRSPRAEPGDDGFLHAVVMRPHLGPATIKRVGGEVQREYPEYRFDWVHDPHPDNQFIVGEPTDVIFIVR